jgi:MinD-like ATPase involved in chromosome partitioning or flagellar assembly
MVKTVSFNAFVSGTGRSNLVANLAALMALDGKCVGVVDLDEATPGQPLLFGLDTASAPVTLTDVLQGRGSVEDATYDVTPPVTGDIRGRIFLLPLAVDTCCQPLEGRARLDPESLEAALAQFGQRCGLDLLLVDSCSGLDELSLSALAMADVAIQVLPLERRSYQGTAVSLDLARRLEVPEIRLVACMASPELNVEAVRRQLGDSFGCGVAAVLPYSAEMAAMGSSALFALARPEHPLTAEMRRLAGWLLS